MRLQPPKNENDFVGKEATKEVIISYIGSHRIVYKDGEKTVNEYIADNQWFNQKHVAGFLSMFPTEIQDLASIYLDELLRHRPVPPQL